MVFLLSFSVRDYLSDTIVESIVKKCDGKQDVSIDELERLGVYVAALIERMKLSASKVTSTNKFFYNKRLGSLQDIKLRVDSHLRRLTK